MDAAQALRELTEISSQIEAACLFGPEGPAIASTFDDDARTAGFTEAARALLAEAESVPRDAGSATLAQLEAATHNGSVFVVREGDRAVAAATKPEPTVGLVFYDLKSCLRASADQQPANGTPRAQGSDANAEEASPSESAA